MAILVINHGAEWTQELYDKAIERAIPDPSNPPAGMLVHTAAPADTGWRVVDVWESEDAYNSFLQETLIPVAQELGAPPFDSQTVAIHNYLIP